MPTTGRSVVERFYARCQPGSRSLFRRLHKRAFTSSWTARLVFGTRLVKEDNRYVCDLTSILLRGEVRRRLRRNPGLRVLELGVGSFALPAGALSRHTHAPIDAVDVRPEYVRSSRAVVRQNGFNVRVVESDLFAALEGATYDLIYWNLPYHRDSAFLRRLFAEAPGHLNQQGQLVLAYNAVALPRDVLLENLAVQPGLYVARIRTWRWNRHEVVVLRRKDDRQPAAGQAATTGRTQ
jgi:SAM-dependent methyltransferase